MAQETDPRAQLTLEGVVGARAGQMCQQFIGPAEQHSVTGPASSMPESLREKRLADANGTAKNDVLVTLDEVQAEEFR
jgi:hypothetical protein